MERRQGIEPRLFGNLFQKYIVSANKNITGFQYTVLIDVLGKGDTPFFIEVI